MSTPLTSWGQFPPISHQTTFAPTWRTDTLPTDTNLIPYGQGRSYGDVALSDHGTVISTHRLNHFISFNPHTGLLRTESGVRLADILQLTIPRGWFLPVTPGTKFISVGGAIAGDIHGKNHHRVGTFGCHVPQFELLRSTGDRLLCSHNQNPDLYRATIGGLGLTGLITWADIQLIPIKAPFLQQQTIKTTSLEETLEVAQQSDASHDYTVTWIDTAASGSAIGRGLCMRANFVDTPPASSLSAKDIYRPPLATMPINAPNWLITNGVTKLFNILYYHRIFTKEGQRTVHYDPFFYPLDIIQHWNRLYGSRGFQSYQCVVPHSNGPATIRRILTTLHQNSLYSPLTVLKIFGDKPSPGLLSFPLPGLNILFDFPNTTRLQQVLPQLDKLVIQAGGRVNPIKDAHLSAADFQTMFHNWHELDQYRDPAFSSSFWRRVTSK